MSQSNEEYNAEEYRTEDAPSIVAETIEDEPVEHEESAEMHEEAREAPQDSASEPDEDHESSPPRAADRYAEAEEDLAAGEADIDVEAEEPARKRSGTAPPLADDVDSENERLFNMYQARIDSKPLGSARRTSARQGATSKAGGTPRSGPLLDGYARRGSSGLVRGNSLQGSLRQSVAGGGSPMDFRRRASVLSSARYNAARASISGASRYSLDRRSSAPMTEGEQFALERMEENEQRRAEAKERAELIRAYRSEDVVDMKLQKERAANERLLDCIHEKERRRQEKIHLNWERQEQARLRREAKEVARTQSIEARITAKGEVPNDPFKMLLAKRRYSTNVVRGEQPVTPHRRITADKQGDATAEAAPSPSAEAGQNGQCQSARAGGQPSICRGTPRSRRSSVQEARDMWRAPAPAEETKGKAWR